MKARIHFTHRDGTDDSIVLSGEDVDDLRLKAEEELGKRGGTEPWSEILEE